MTHTADIDIFIIICIMQKKHLMKKLGEQIAAFIALLFISIPSILIMIAIRIETPGNPLHRHQRVGKGGRLFRILKFRTMRKGDPPTGITTAEELWLHEAHRVTKVGAFLRMTNLDELPQLWNILMGTMSVVGPRPHVYDETINRYYAPRDENILPGLTGLEQVSRLRATKGYRAQHLAKYYCRRKCTLLDLYIVLFLTPRFIFATMTSTAALPIGKRHFLLERWIFDHYRFLYDDRGF